MNRNFISALIIAARPKTLSAVVVPIAIGLTLAQRDQSIDYWVVLTIILFGLSIQICTNFANDYFDFIKGTDNSSRQGPMRVMQHGLMSKRQMQLLIIAILLISIILGILLMQSGGVQILFLAVICGALAIAYTGGPFPLAYLGLGDIFVFIFFGPIASGYTYFLLTQNFSSLSFIAGIAPGLISTAILVANNIRDYDNDKASGKQTLVVRFGKNFGRIEYLCLITSSALLPIILSLQNFAIGRAYYASIFIFPAIPVMRRVWNSDNSKTLNEALVQTSKLLVLFGIIFCIGLIG